MERIRRHFKKIDPVLYGAIQNDDWYTLVRAHDHFTGLCRIIVGQQVSVKAAESIFAKFCAFFPKNKPTATLLLTLTDAKIRSAGLSTSKTAAVRDLASRVTNKSLPLKKIGGLSNEALMTELVKVKGIGPWSAEMFLIFYLGREDVFSAGDLGLRTAIMKLYKKRALPSPEAATKLAERWAPYRSYACRILWRSLANSPTP